VTLKERECIWIIYQNIHFSETKINPFHVMSWLEAPFVSWNLFGVWKVNKRNSAISEQSMFTSPEIRS
jgi:hypothetical protein